MFRLHLIIAGRVQGVFFRAYTEQEARRLGLAGWVKNLADRRVETVAEGEKEALEEYKKWCHHGPPAAHVTHVDVPWEEATGEFKDFTVRH